MTPLDFWAMGLGLAGSIATVLCMAQFARPKVRCPTCLGFKTIRNTDDTPVICPRCNGDGEIEQ